MNTPYYVGKFILTTRVKGYILMVFNGLGRSLENSHRNRGKPRKGHKIVSSVLEEPQIEDCINFKSFSGESIVIYANSEEKTVPNKSVLSDLESFAFLTLPKKPKWSDLQSAEEYQNLETAEFYRWRSKLATLENSNSHIIMTPFERNLSIWRELWRAVEKANILFQVLDCRNPLFFFSVDLFNYCREVNPSASLKVILNKADLLSDAQIKLWAEYFGNQNIDYVFFSSYSATECGRNISGDLKVLSPPELSHYIQKNCESSESVVSFVGYPNVGKSSTINSLLGVSKAAVSSTPGKTKHIQTFLTPGFTICDCPGLVFPQIATSKSELYLNGVLPIDQLRDYLQPIALLVDRIPMTSIESTYNIRIVTEHNVSVTESVLSSYAKSRGFSTSNFGNPDMARASRILLKDYSAGKLLHCHPPPGIDPYEFNGVEKDIRIPRQVTDPKLYEGNVASIQINSNKIATNSGKKHHKMNKRK